MAIRFVNISNIFIRYEKTSEDLIRVKTALNEKEMEVEDLIRKLKEANDKVLSGFCLPQHPIFIHFISFGKMQ